MTKLNFFSKLYINITFEYKLFGIVLFKYNKNRPRYKNTSLHTIAYEIKTTLNNEYGYYFPPW
jgi:hypothetical protein